MRFCLMHLDDAGESDDLTITVPGGEPVAMMVPLGALDKFLPILAEATADLGEQCCEACGAGLPGLRRAEDDGG